MPSRLEEGEWLTRLAPRSSPPTLDLDCNKLPRKSWQEIRGEIKLPLPLYCHNPPPLHQFTNPSQVQSISSRSASAITFCTNSSILDNGQHKGHDGLFRGALLAFKSTTDPDRSIQIAFHGSPNYGSMPNASPNLGESTWMRFESVPPKGQGTLTIKHDLSLDRLFLYSRNLKPADVKPGEKSRIRMNPRRAFMRG